MAVEEHSQDLILLREELTATHTQLVATHKAEIANVAEKAEKDLNDLRQIVLSTQHTLDIAEEENRELMAKLEEATMNAGGGSALEEKLKEATRKLAELQDELEGTKTVSSSARNVSKLIFRWPT